MLQRPNIAINRYVTKSIYFSEFSTMQDQTNMQRPAYCVLGHSPLRLEISMWSRRMVMQVPAFLFLDALFSMIFTED